MASAMDSVRDRVAAHSLGVALIPCFLLHPSPGSGGEARISALIGCATLREIDSDSTGTPCLSWVRPYEEEK